MRNISLPCEREVARRSRDGRIPFPRPLAFPLPGGRCPRRGRRGLTPAQFNPGGPQAAGVLLSYAVFRFYNKCWGQVKNLTPTFIIEPLKIIKRPIPGTRISRVGNGSLYIKLGIKNGQTRKNYCSAVSILVWFRHVKLFFTRLHSLLTVCFDYSTIFLKVQRFT